MKQVNFLIAALFSLLLSVNVQAQSKTGADYFAGKWSLLVKGTPSGDSKMFVLLEKKDSEIIGSVIDSTGKEMSKLTKTELAGDKLTIYFTSAEGFDVNIEMNKKDEDHITGSVMGMFDVEGDRIKGTN